MERIKHRRPQYSINEEPIVISKPTLDIFLKQDNPGDLIALYTFYYYTAKWQKTNQPKSTTYYTAKGLGWSEDRVRKRKNTLKQLKLIEDIQTYGEGNKITGHYIHVNFIWSKEKIHPHGFPHCGAGHTVESSEGNALSANTINALSTVKNIKLHSPEQKSSGESDSSKSKKPSKEERNKLYLPICSKLSRIICTRKNMKYTPSVLKGWSNEIRQLVESNKISVDRINKVLDWYAENNNISRSGNKYIPVVESGFALREKFVRLEDAMERNNSYKITSSPEEILQSHFDSDWLLKTMEANYKQACQFTTKDNASDLAESLCKLYDWIKENQSPDVLLKVNDNINPSGLIKQYITWLSSQSWIDEISSQTFNPRNNLFRKKFLESKNRELNIDVLTGQFTPSYESR